MLHIRAIGGTRYKRALAGLHIRASGANIENGINDKELASLFKKTQLLSDKQKQTVKELISAFVFQKDIQKQLA